MLVEFIESVADVLVSETIRDEAMGDFWERDYRLKRDGSSLLIRIVRGVVSFLGLIVASRKIDSGLVRVPELPTEPEICAPASFFDRDAQYETDRDAEIPQPSRSIAFDPKTQRLESSGTQTNAHPSTTPLSNSDMQPKITICSGDGVRETKDLFDPGVQQKVRAYFQRHIDCGNQRSARIFLGTQTEGIETWLDRADTFVGKVRDNGAFEFLNADLAVSALVLGEVVKRVERSHPEEIESRDFEKLVRQIELPQDFIERFISKSDDSLRQLVFRTWSLVVYVITWRPGQMSSVHHHGKALHTTKVLQGEMTHWLLTPKEVKQRQDADKIQHEFCDRNFTLDECQNSKRCLPGDTVFVDRYHAHQIANLSDEPLITLHIRCGNPPEDSHWQWTRDPEMLVWNTATQTMEMKQPTPAAVRDAKLRSKSPA